jgi:tRNA/rRNA methyltransferase
MPPKPNPNNVTIVLHRPGSPENIGAAARVIRNMGIGGLVVVAPYNYDETRIRKMATHEASDIVEQIKVATDLKEALAPFHYVVGTTARIGRQRKDIVAPNQIAPRVAELSARNRTAFLFGPEDRGLTNENLRLCHALVNIPTAEFSSLNLAQAVMVMCYEYFMAASSSIPEFTPRLASRLELDNMYDHLKDVLIRISFINRQNPDYWMNNIRLFFSRLELRAKEVSIIRGILRQMDWYAEKRFQDGRKLAEKGEQ